VIPPPPHPKNANPPERSEMKYLPRRCRFLKEEVWAILIQQAGGRWEIVNCLDKHEPCFKHDCVFTTDDGQWPFDAAPSGGRKPVVEGG